MAKEQSEEDARYEDENFDQICDLGSETGSGFDTCECGATCCPECITDSVCSDCEESQS